MSDDLIGSSAVIAALRGAIDRVAQTNSRVLILGAAGAGKELIARLLHERRPRGDGPFVAINAASIAPERMESEIFGEEGPEGRPRKIGVFEQAHGGTLFLDEVGDMPMETQSKILRVLVDQRFRRLDGATDVQVNVRVVSSTSRDLRGDIEQQRFREDLFHRLNVVPLRAAEAWLSGAKIFPILRAISLAVWPACRACRARQIGEDALAALQAADWPGNVRQLRNVIERILILADRRAIDAGHRRCAAAGRLAVAPAPSATACRKSSRCRFATRASASSANISNVQITRFGGNISRTAAFIGMERSALHRKLKSLGVDSNSAQVAFVYYHISWLGLVYATHKTISASRKSLGGEAPARALTFSLCILFIFRLPAPSPSPPDSPRPPRSSACAFGSMRLRKPVNALPGPSSIKRVKPCASR